MRLSSNIFPHKLLPIDRNVSKVRKAFINNKSANIKLSKIELSKIVQSSGFLGRLLGPLLKTRLSLMKTLLNPLMPCGNKTVTHT